MREVEVMEIDKITLETILERIKADCLDLEESKAKAETEYQLQKCRLDKNKDEER